MLHCRSYLYCHVVAEFKAHVHYGAVASTDAERQWVRKCRHSTKQSGSRISEREDTRKGDSGMGIIRKGGFQAGYFCKKVILEKGNSKLG